MKKNDVLVILNERIGNVIKEKKSVENDDEVDLDFDVLEKIYKRVLFNKGIMPEYKKIKVVPIKKTELIDKALKFFKSIDGELYKKAEKIVEGKNENISFHFIDAYDRTKQIDSHVLIRSGKSKISIFMQKDLPQGYVLPKDLCILEDLYDFVHEVAHTFDFDYDEPMKGFNVSRELYGECTTKAFEGMLTQYLLEKTNYSKSAIIQIYNRRFNDLYDMVNIQYAKLLLAKEKEKTGVLTKESIQSFMQKNNLSMNFMIHIINKINWDNMSFMKRNKYCLAAIISPRIVERYANGGSKVLKGYLESVKKDKQEDVLDITIDEKGIRELLSDMKKLDFIINSYKSKDEVEMDEK